ncbi:hypothetical protein ACFWV1_06525 [Streptomyces sp. NPDC058700]|uniref:hypothetical protein n=1 Tax=Streptomyces sp. NPDC058700 TaxID=3346607 RepID=UPI00365F2D2B
MASHDHRGGGGGVVIPYCERDLARAFDIRQRIGLLLVATGEHTAGQGQLQQLLFDAERAYGPYHPLPVDLRRALEHQRRLWRGS